MDVTIMSFWFFMLSIILLIPLIMIGFGWIFIKSAPKDINYVFGYRTPMSTSSEEAWKFAHKYFGRIWFILGFIILIPSVIGVVCVAGLDKDTVGYVGTAITFAQMFFMIIPMIPTEIELKKNFDKNGNRKI